MKVVIFLQNAWSPVYAGREWPRRSWLQALARSRSGQRLKCLTDDFDECENTTPICGATPCSIVPPSISHITEILIRRTPDVVIACGKQAERELSELWTGPLVCVPHPAHRLLTNDLYLKAQSLLTDNFKQRISLVQKRGRVLIIPKP